MLSSDRDDSFIKLHEASSVLFAARVRMGCMLVFISRNRNYNGFDLIGWFFLLFSECECMAFSSFCCRFLVRFTGC